MMTERTPAAPEARRTQVALSQLDSMHETSTLSATEASFVSPRELAQMLGITIDSVYRLVARRALPVYRVLRRILFRRSEVERWLAAHRTDSRNPELWQ